ncbi:immunity 53 family protein [Paenibacillus apiarius]|uniref:Immunity 53 family protein n=1 Tax=Paenibacillus apiarius TaxID=46240 RepID=A0ABT4DPU8_9BACL|nr:immunity 53 family protein [Paenibacillus apiarius]MBN3524651.1 immunity 53 family protein [Paenibacillus apiarius]MCY9515548.1 immunity 53 family protein [Paenibacillus apiarius]MCY9519379.1 immunity 53 family protein [Paenibacillus apiarius]MCY9551015.1 immunity 53 family protein [Paenibacillus apiarius]MCY9558893.1 immunity 53 family protein [Paenibacillus apiarius]
METLKWLQNWYYQNCNGDWEHSYGVKIDTVDNPGWSVEINLADTYLENEHFDSIEDERDDQDWFYCIVRDGVFQGAGGAMNLEEILNCFRQWASSVDRYQ